MEDTKESQFNICLFLLSIGLEEFALHFWLTYIEDQLGLFTPIGIDGLSLVGIMVKKIPRNRL